jgi:hypothetical protein
MDSDERAVFQASAREDVSESDRQIGSRVRAMIDQTEVACALSRKIVDRCRVARESFLGAQQRSSHAPPTLTSILRPALAAATLEGMAM